MNVVGIIIGIIIVGGAVVFVVFGLRYSREKQDSEVDPVMLRLAEATQRGESVSLEQMELQQPFSERVILPIMEKVGEILTRFTPQKLLQETTLKLALAGNPGRIDAATFLATRFVGAAIFGGGLLMISLFSATQWKFSTDRKSVV
jgi:tight adherence protein C